MKTLALAIALGLAATTAQASDWCQQHGYYPGTALYMDCMRTVNDAQQRQQVIEQQRWNALLGYSAALMAPQPRAYPCVNQWGQQAVCVR